MHYYPTKKRRSAGHVLERVRGLFFHSSTYDCCGLLALRYPTGMNISEGGKQLFDVFFMGIDYGDSY